MSHRSTSKDWTLLTLQAKDSSSILYNLLIAVLCPVSLKEMTGVHRQRWHRCCRQWPLAASHLPTCSYIQVWTINKMNMVSMKRLTPDSGARRWQWLRSHYVLDVSISTAFRLESRSYCEDPVSKVSWFDQRWRHQKRYIIQTASWHGQCRWGHWAPEKQYPMNASLFLLVSSKRLYWGLSKIRSHASYARSRTKSASPICMEKA